MKYLSNRNLEFYVKKKVKESIYGVVATIFLFVILSFGLYYKSLSTIIYSINLVVIGVLSSALIYSLTRIEGLKINKIVNEIIIGTDKICFSTYSYRFLFYKIISQRIELSKENIHIQEIEFPFNSSGLNDNKTFSVNLDAKNIYICYQCFSDGLLLELKPLLTLV